MVLCNSHLSQMGQESNALHGLPQTHLISQDPIDALVVQTGQPVHALQLVALELPLQ